MQACYDFDKMRRLSVDTVVIGGGVSGCAAAIAAARGGCKTLLVEADGVLGGQAGIGLVTPLSSQRDRKRVSFGGLLDEIVLSTEELTKKYARESSDDERLSAIAPHITKYNLLRLLKESGANVAFHTHFCDALVEDGRLSSVVLHDKSGFLLVCAKSFIDASGDADLIVLAGDDYVLGSEKGVFDQLIDAKMNMAHFSERTSDRYEGEHLMQPTSLFFVMRGVDAEVAMQFNNKRIELGDLGITRERFDAWAFSGTLGFTVVDERVPMPQNRVLVTYGRHRDEVVVNMSRVTEIDGSDAFSLSEGECKAQLQLIAIVDFLKTFIPGFENSYLVETSSHLGVRETRRLVGKYVLTGTDVIRSRTFDDTICRALYMIDIHDPRGRFGAIGGFIEGDYYEIPFRSLCSAKFDNLFAVGRCISADHVAHSATRIQGTCILTGQAAGTACALAKREGIAPVAVDAEKLRNQLKADGVTL